MSTNGKQSEIMNYEDFYWVCEYCKDGEDAYRLANVSWINSFIHIHGNVNKIVNLRNDGKIFISCPRCFCINISNEDPKMKLFCDKLFSEKKPVDIRNIAIPCSHNMGCNQEILGKLQNGDEGRIMLSAAPENKKHININIKGVAISCPKCSEKTAAGWNINFSKFWQSMIPKKLIEKFINKNKETDNEPVVIGEG